jgi:hypothetical protein
MKKEKPVEVPPQRPTLPGFSSSINQEEAVNYNQSLKEVKKEREISDVQK